MKGDPGLISAAVKLDIQWSHVCLECQPRSRSSIAYAVRSRVKGKLTANDKVIVVWKRTWIPCCKALGVTVIAALGLICVADQGPMEVHLFAWVVLVHIDTVPCDIIGGVLYRI